MDTVPDSSCIVLENTALTIECEQEEEDSHLDGDFAEVSLDLPFPVEDESPMRLCEAVLIDQANKVEEQAKNGSECEGQKPRKTSHELFRVDEESFQSFSIFKATRYLQISPTK